MSEIIYYDEFSYQWRIEDGLAVLYQHGQTPLKYQLSSLQNTLQNVKSDRNSYATQTEWERQVQMFENGLALLGNHKLAHEDQESQSITSRGKSANY